MGNQLADDATKVAKYPQYRVPQSATQALVEPAREQLLEHLQAPLRIASKGNLEFCGNSLEDARRAARQEALDVCRKYTGGYATPAFAEADVDHCPILLSGHQPELFHAGVWFKNFILSDLAVQSGGIAINFLVDNDLCRSSSIRVPHPTGNPNARPRVQSIGFDHERDAVPWELRGIESEELWHSFPERVRAAMGDAARDLIVDELWKPATAALKRHGKPGWALAEARHLLEMRHGLKTLEVPLHALVSTRAFARFSIHLLAELPRLQAVYNAQRQSYREAHRIRNQAHPVPALEESGGWLEAPWWVYRAAAPQRQRLWVRLLDDQLILSDRAGWQAVIEGRLDCDSAATQWLDLLADGICLRPRALLTTMYLRLFIGDLFVHGIGGAKYDQVTDGILSEFFGVTAPPVAVATATMHLPLARHAKASPQQVETQIAEARQQLWQLQHRGESLEPGQLGPEALAEHQKLKELKSDLLERMPAKGERWQWHQEMKAVTEQLREIASGAAEVVAGRLDALQDTLRDSRILSSREYSFCLFDHSLLDTLKQLSASPNSR